jgi:hypothetical protein
MEQRFRSTRNPALIAQCERLLERVARLGIGKLEPLSLDGAETVLGYSAVVSGTVAELSAAADPGSYALQLVMARAKATSGYLYLRRQGALELAAASGPTVPPDHVEAALKDLVDRALAEPNHSPWTSVPPASGTSSVAGRSTSSLTSTTGSAGHSSEHEADQTALVGASDGSSSQRSGGDDSEGGETQAISDQKTGRTVFVRSVPPPNPWSGFQLLLLETRQADQRVVVGGMIIEAKPHEVARVSKELLKGMARVLLNRHVTTVLGTLQQ